MGNDVAGATLSIVSSVISNIGVNLQKRVHVRNENIPPAKRVPYTKQPAWWVGLGGVIFGAVGDFIALGLASQAVCTALGGATTLWANILIARFWLNEELSWWDVSGVFLIVVGAVIIAVETPASEEEYKLEQLTAMSRRFAFKVRVSAVTTL